MNQSVVRNGTGKRRILLSCAFGGLVFLLWLAFWNAGLFPSDEEEIFVKGYAMAHGKVLYRDLISQHMPLPYQFAALFAAAGAHSVTGFRIGFYLLFGLLAGLCFFRCAPRFGARTVAAAQLIYLSVIASLENGTVILADQLEAAGLALLFFELLLFFRERRLTGVSAVFISLASSLAFLSSFAAVFPVFACFLGVLAVEIRDTAAAKENPGRCILRLLRRYVPLMFLMLLPLTLEAAYLASSGTLRACFDEAYRFNTEVYPKYYPGGYGGSVPASLLGGLTKLGAAFQFSRLSFTVLLQIGVLGLALLFLVDRVKREAGSGRGRWEAAAAAFYLVACATRGCFDYHGLPAVAVLSVMAAFVLESRRVRIRAWAGHTRLRAAAVLLVLCAAFSPYLVRFPNLFRVAAPETVRTDSLAWALDQLTEPLEEIGFTSYQQDLLLDAGVLVATRYTGSTPWYWEWGRTDCMSQLEADPPKIYVYDSTLNVWGYAVSQYAPEIGAFLDRNYRSLSDLGFPSLYVRNDCYTEAHAKLDPTVLYGSTEEGPDAEPLRAGQSVGEVFHCPLTTDIANIEVRVNGVEHPESLRLRLELEDETAVTRRTLTVTDLSGWSAGSVRTVAFDPVRLKKDHSYRLLLSLSGDGSVTFARGRETGTAAVGTQRDGKTEPWLLSLRIVKAQTGVVMVVRK